MQTATPVVPVMEYASNYGGTIDPRARAVARPMMVAAVGSGLCVLVCFGPLVGFPSPLWAILHPIVFLVTLAAGIRTGKAMRDGWGERMICDVVACVGLVGLAMSPLVLLLEGQNEDDWIPLGGAALGICYLLMAVTTVRHLLLYQMLARWMRIGGAHRLARGMLAMGWVKMIYEGLWLGCCAAALFCVSSGNEMLEGLFVPLGLAALFGCFGFAAIWIWMMITHALLLRRAGA